MKRPLRALIYGLTAVPPILLLVFIVTQAVNVPYWDQYELVPLFEHMHDGTLTFADIWNQHNEHRIFFPKLIMITAAIATQWDVRFEMILSWLTALGSFTILLFALRSATSAFKKATPIWLPLLLSVIFFSVIQHENWLWGWQIQWHLSVLGVLLVVYGITRHLSNKHSLFATILIVGGAIIAQYSLGSGVLIWPLIVVSLVFVRVGWRRIIILVGIGLVSTVLFYFGYNDPPGSVSKLALLQQPLEFFAYIALYLGRPLSYSHVVTLLGGIGVTLIFVGIGTYLFVKHRQRFVESIPWLVLGLYVISSAVLTAIARLGFGVGQSLSSRYTTLASLLLIALIMLVYMNKDILKRLFKKPFRYYAGLAVLITFALVTTNAIQSLGTAQHQTNRLKDLYTCSRLVTPTDECYLVAFPDVQLARERINYLKLIHWGGY